jgi:hypothetical protein
MWTTAAVAAAFSITVAFVGALRPMPPGGYKGYTAGSALKQIVGQAQPTGLAER